MDQDVSAQTAADTLLSASAGNGGIELSNLTKRYGLASVVDNVSVHVRAGEFFSLLGPSGSGKTTTLMMIAGFVATDEGRIIVSGRDVAHQSPQERGFGMVFQNYAIFPHLSVAENVAFPLRVRRLPKEDIRRRVKWALELVQLQNFADRFSKQLSGGQQQRVALARAIVFHPKIVLMDEPLGALDKNLRYQMQVEIKEIQQRLGMTVVYVTHDQEEAMNMSDRLAIMNRGRIDQVARPGEIYDRPANPFVARFLGQANLIEGCILTDGGVAAALEMPGGARLQGSSTSPLAAKESAFLFVRPEKVSLSRSSATSVLPPETNSIDARTRRMSFLGNIIRYTFDVGQAEDVTVDVPNAGNVLRLNPGDGATLSWAIADSLFLARQP